MKNIGLILISLGFLAGAYLSALDARTVNWTYMGIALLVGLLGVVLVQISKKSLSQDKEILESNISIIEKSIENIVNNLGRLNAAKDQIHTYDMCHKLDELLIDDLNHFVEARQTIGHRYSLSAYADVMNHFAGGERYVNRVWSASADGYIDEVNEYLQKALDQFTEAQSKLEELKSKG
jgi:hypothetical protein